jgi:hypothetical protein
MVPDDYYTEATAQARVERSEDLLAPRSVVFSTDAGVIASGCGLCVQCEENDQS